MSIRTDVAKIKAIWRGPEAPPKDYRMEVKRKSVKEWTEVNGKSVKEWREKHKLSWRTFEAEEREEKRLCVYIAGPVSGIPSFNRAAFAEAECALRRIGYKVFNPTAPGSGYPNYCPEAPRIIHLRRGLRELLYCDAVYALPGYLHSFARIEVEVAKELELPVFYEKYGFCVWALKRDNKKMEALNEQKV